MMTTRKRRTAILVAGTVLAASAVAVSPPRDAVAGPTAESTHHGLRAQLQRDADKLLDYGAPGVLVGLDTAGRDLKVRSGQGDLRAGTPVPWRAKFRIASFTKPFVSATLLQLVGEGRLSLDDTVDHWLPGVVRGNGNDGRRITVRMLLGQTSGLPEYLVGFPEFFTEEGFRQNRFKTVTGRQAVAAAMKFKPAFAPGTQWAYSNTNYALAGLVIEAVTKHRWQDEVRRLVLRPLGLHETYLPGTSPTIPWPHATSYERFPGPGATPEDPKYGKFVDVTLQNPSYGGAAGEIISTTDDANRFLRGLIGGKLLPPRLLAEMQKTVPTTGGFQQGWPGSRYGLGLLWIPNECGGSWAHGGDIVGFQTRNGVSADGKRSVVVSVNTDSYKPKPGVSLPTKDLSQDLIDHALCNSR